MLSSRSEVEVCGVIDWALRNRRDWGKPECRAKECHLSSERFAQERLAIYKSIATYHVRNWWDWGKTRDETIRETGVRLNETWMKQRMRIGRMSRMCRGAALWCFCQSCLAANLSRPWCACVGCAPHSPTYFFLSLVSSSQSRTGVLKQWPSGHYTLLLLFI